MIQKITKNFSPLLFLMSLGAGGISVAGFALTNYALPHGQGLITKAQVDAMNLNAPLGMLFGTLEWIMIIFAVLHIVLSVLVFLAFIQWRKTKAYRELAENPLANSALVAPFISGVMTFNVVIASVRYFVPAVHDNLQAMMLPALIAWGLIWFWLLVVEMRLLKTMFVRGFDMSKVHFGWLLHPFALGMTTVTGTGIAALSHDPTIAHTAAFMSLVTGTMAVFLLNIKLSSIFQRHFSGEGMPENQFLPSFLIVIPNITLLAISAYRLAHYVSHQFGVDTEIFSMLVLLVSFAFEVWYFMFGITMINEGLKTNARSGFHVSLWGLICPFVAFAVLGAFVYSTFAPIAPFLWFNGALIVVTSALFVVLLKKQFATFR
jgi:tellurite resistance protein TehA-like permease